MVGGAVLSLLLPIGSGSNIARVKVLDARLFLSMASGIVICRQQKRYHSYALLLIALGLSWILQYSMHLATSETKIEL